MNDSTADRADLETPFAVRVHRARMHRRLPVILVSLLAPCVTTHAISQKDADALVQQLSGLPTEIQASGFSRICPSARAQCPPRPLPADEAKRKDIYDQLFALGKDGVAALARALGSRDSNLRGNAALALGVLSGGWWKADGSRIDISYALPALEMALQDPDSRTRELAAQDIGDVGEAAAQAVPALVELLTSEDEGLRNSACIVLRRIGPPARDALPALRVTLADPSPDVRRFAQSAIASIEELPPQETASPEANADALTIRISPDGVCYFSDASAPCDHLGQYLVTNNVAAGGHIHIAVDQASKYELVAATLESLQGLGFKVGFVASSPQ
jgi:biopolymer transport protein ExbD